MTIHIPWELIGQILTAVFTIGLIIGSVLKKQGKITFGDISDRRRTPPCFAFCEQHEKLFAELASNHRSLKETVSRVDKCISKMGDKIDTISTKLAHLEGMMAGLHANEE